jgi:hypothetical protein
MKLKHLRPQRPAAKLLENNRLLDIQKCLCDLNREVGVREGQGRYGRLLPGSPPNS